MTRILIVEDDVEQARGMARVFSKLRPDLAIEVAHNGVEATRLMTEKPVDLVLTDLQMPEMDGFALLAWMHNTYPDVPVFTMSGVGRPNHIIQAGSLYRTAKSGAARTRGAM